MTPEGKAKELVRRFKEPECDYHNDVYMCKHLAKTCALICVDEIIEACCDLCDDSIYLLSDYSEYKRMVEYFTQVKTEIEKL